MRLSPISHLRFSACSGKTKASKRCPAIVPQPRFRARRLSGLLRDAEVVAQIEVVDFQVHGFGSRLVNSIHAYIARSHSYLRSPETSSGFGKNSENLCPRIPAKRLSSRGRLARCGQTRGTGESGTNSHAQRCRVSTVNCKNRSRSEQLTKVNPPQDQRFLQMGRSSRSVARKPRHLWSAIASKSICRAVRSAAGPVDRFDLRGVCRDVPFELLVSIHRARLDRSKAFAGTDPVGFERRVLSKPGRYADQVLLAIIWRSNSTRPPPEWRMAIPRPVRW